MPIPILANMESELRLVNQEIITIFSPDLLIVAEEARRVLHSEGKRIRPALVLLSAGAFQGISPLAISIAAIAEGIHIASLLHDDVVDNVNTRRGGTFLTAERKNKISVLLADFFLTRVFEWLYRKGIQDFVGIIAETTGRMVRGQLLELQWQNRFEITREDYLSIIEGKTSSLFSTCCRMGAIVGKAPAEDVENLSCLGREIGIVFQIVDDCLDFWGDERILGKPTGTDLRERKFTLPFILTLERASSAELSRIRSVLADGSLDREGFSLILEIMERYRVRADSLALARSFCDRAIKYIRTLASEEARNSLLRLAEYILAREM